MLIAKLRISLRDANIQYNRCTELGTDKVRGTVLEDGKVIRGLGTHFANKEAQERYDRLTKESNVIREKFNRQFMRTPIDGTFIITAKGEAKTFIDGLLINPELDVSVIEFELGAPDSLDETEMREWSTRVKNQLTRIPLGRGEEVDTDGLAALETLAGCPVLAQATADNIRAMIAQVRIGKLNRVDFRRSIELLEVSMDQGALSPSRNNPIA
jgi:hypothetical protein